MNIRPTPSPEPLRDLQTEIESFIRSLEHPVVVEHEIELFDLTAAEWRLTIEFGKLLLEVWNPARSLVRRVDEIAYRQEGRVGLFVRRPGGRETHTLEFRELESASRPARAAGRSAFRQGLVAMLGREFTGWKLERVASHSDREHSLSAWYTRGLARRGKTAWAFLGLGEEETPAAADAALAFGLIWLDWLRDHPQDAVVSGLKLFLPRSAVELAAHRAAHLDPRAAQIEILEWRPGQERPAPIDLRDFGNVATSLVPRQQSDALIERHRGRLTELLGDLAGRVDVLPGATGNFLSLRVLGLEVGRVEGLLAPRIFFGLEGSFRRFEAGHQQELRKLVSGVVELRQVPSPDPSHDFYRLQGERWLERLIVGDITKMDPALLPECVYPQVPAFAGDDRGVIDILTATRHGRLAVIELKLTEEINLPLQGLDYWLRVKWLHERGQFQRAGYFPGLDLAPEWPRLILVSPAFRFHSTTGRLVGYFHPSIEIVQVGLNNRWREQLTVLFRRDMRPPARSAASSK